jgi:hypothetical protein
VEQGGETVSDDDDVYLDKITQQKAKTFFHMQNVDQPEKA